MENENVELEPVQNESVAENEPVPPIFLLTIDAQGFPDNLPRHVRRKRNVAERRV
ncbi:hypothetical protein [Achromobacter spanius]|uniref:hypothetical protein n=1 Tax=Achromobacter spanius TaxID=217203 RepID=UPI001319F130|nr:hypothetical protein [Achromobacter spanius]